MATDHVVLEIASQDEQLAYGLHLTLEAIVLMRRRLDAPGRWRRRAQVCWDTNAQLFVSEGSLNDLDGASLHALAMAVRQHPALHQRVARHPTTR